MKNIQIVSIFNNKNISLSTSPSLCYLFCTRLCLVQYFTVLNSQNLSPSRLLVRCLCSKIEQFFSFYLCFCLNNNDKQSDRRTNEHETQTAPSTRHILNSILMHSGFRIQHLTSPTSIQLFNIGLNNRSNN